MRFQNVLLFEFTVNASLLRNSSLWLLQLVQLRLFTDSRVA